MKEKIINVGLVAKKDEDVALNLIFEDKKPQAIKVFKQKFKSLDFITKNLIVATSHDFELLASALVLPNFWKTSTIYFSNPKKCNSALNKILHHAPIHASKDKSTLIQATLYSTEQMKIRSLEKSNFIFIGNLLFLSGNTQNFKNHSNPKISIKKLPLTNKEIVFKIFQKTIKKTLDFPKLNTFRSPKDLIEGYLHMSHNDKSLWLIAYLKSSPVGIAIASKHPNEKNVDIHYLGVVPEARKKGVGSALLNSLLKKSLAIGCDQAFLSCDAGNTVARRLYEQNKFSIESEKLAFVLPTTNYLKPISPPVIQILSQESG